MLVNVADSNAGKRVLALCPMSGLDPSASQCPDSTPARRNVRTRPQRVDAYPTAETLRRRLTVTDFIRLFTFLTVPGVEPTNNHAEQALRGPVIMRKITFGTRSAEGSLAHGVLPSLLLTAQRQGRDPLQFFRTLFTADSATAQAALYRNPPDTS